MIGLVCILPIMDGIELAGWKNSVEFNALVGWWKLFLYFCGNLGCFHIHSDQYTPEHKNSF